MINAGFIDQIGLGTLRNFNSFVTSVAIDSRKVTTGAMFFALQGEKADGHYYLDSAVAQGAALCVVSQEWADQNSDSKLPLWIVESPKTALQQLALRWRREFKIPVLAITGTNGKTTTRAMCQTILKKRYFLHSTSGNFNNQLGLPLTLLSLTPEHTFSLLELGSNHFGEINFLCQICQPTAGLITNIGYGHTEFFKDLAGVLKAKKELFDSLPVNGISFINNNDDLLAPLKPATKIVTYGLDRQDVDYRGKIISYDQNACGILQVNEDVTIHLKIPGKPVVQNALAAIAVACTYDVNWSDIQSALEDFEAVNQRFVVTQYRNCRIINDAYNANPNSTTAAIETFSRMNVPGRRVFVFGDMLELGPISKAVHREIGQKVTATPIDWFYTYGPLSELAAEEVLKGGNQQVRSFRDKKELLAVLKKNTLKTDTILFKGSRANHLEDIIEGIVG
jgi:UDP-N-acetylmuramoyl-tripeptide--D-alanyl-D-alanine ligase